MAVHHPHSSRAKSRSPGRSLIVALWIALTGILLASCSPDAAPAPAPPLSFAYSIDVALSKLFGEPSVEGKSREILRGALLRELSPLGVRDEQLGDRARFCSVDVDGKQVVVVIETNPLAAKVYAPSLPLLIFGSEWAVAIDGSRLVLEKGKPSDEAIRAAMSPPLEDPNPAILQLHVDVEKVMSGPGLRPEELLRGVFETSGFSVEAAEKVALLRPLLRLTDDYVELLRSIHGLDISLRAESNTLSLDLGLDPIPDTSLARFTRDHEQRMLVSPRFVPPGTALWFFSSIQPNALSEASLDCDVSTLPWTDLERRYLERARVEILTMRGEMAVAADRLPGKSARWTLFTASPRPGDLLRLQLSTRALTAARERASAGSTELLGADFAPDRLDVLAARALGVSSSSFDYNTRTVGSTTLWRFGRKWGPRWAATAAAVPEGLVTVVDGDEDTIGAFAEGSRYLREQHAAEERSLRLSRGPWLGLLLDLTQMESPLRAKDGSTGAASLLDFAHPFIADVVDAVHDVDWADVRRLTGVTKVSVAGWAQGGVLRFQIEASLEESETLGALLRDAKRWRP